MRTAATLMLLACLVSASSWADSSKTTGRSCLALAAARYGQDEKLLRAVAKVESNYVPTAVHYDADGTHDVGIMQINSSHFGELQRRWNLDEQALIEHPCANVFVGAWILSDFVARFGATWRAVGAYGAGTAAGKESARAAYAALVSHALAKIGRAKATPASTRAADPLAPRSEAMVATTAVPRTRLLVLE